METESVWDYPRPPRLEKFSGHIRIEIGQKILVDSAKCLRILETSHPPTYYIPIADLDGELIRYNDHSSFCEFKGRAAYIDVLKGQRWINNAGWFYPSPSQKYEQLQDHACLYASKMDKCWVNDELVQAQDGDFYGGWITSNIKGPFKGGPGTWGW